MPSAPPSRRRERRTQEQRSALTRARVIRAATECIAEQGLVATSTAAIADRAGVTWGAIQHQFGDKDSILDAVLEQALADLEAHFAGLRDAEPDPRRRLQAFVRRASALLDGPSYPAFVEIQLTRGRDGDAASEQWSEYVAAALERLWLDVFADVALPRRRLLAAERFFFVVASGIAAESILFPKASFQRSHLAALEEALLRMLELEP